MGTGSLTVAGIGTGSLTVAGMGTGSLTMVATAGCGRESTSRNRRGIRLKMCCNATGSLYLTKHNTAVNQTIPYETSRKHTHTVDAALHTLLPEDFPWSGRGLGQCAVVGSGGILKNSSCGRQIDSADFVIRFNLAPVNDSDVGLKTDLITINPSQIRKQNLQNIPGLFAERVSVYGNSSLILPAFAYTYDTQLSIKSLKALQPIRPQQQVAFFSPDFLRTLDLPSQ
ncbi:alpha-2,8-sialyltransferase 8F-like [Xyrauchen texanus]|uniref:alpha-2,8-sialyltransferase 8F-like n=1 Tax=Xyrauchen texanus TaxID=154827 RepID=UPI00224191FE|nr:alpha-2,8-sialyltransferase 8F-like [Xyrauchen texanus]